MSERGRPVEWTYSEEIVERICDLIATSSKGLEHILKEAQDLPSATVVYKWLREHTYFQQQYARARERQADMLVYEAVQIADTPRMGVKRKEDPEGGVEITTADMIEHRRLQVDTRKWMAGKLHPKKYGDKLDVTTKGEQIAPIQGMVIVRPDAPEV